MDAEFAPRVRTKIAQYSTIDLAPAPHGVSLCRCDISGKLLSAEAGASVRAYAGCS